MKSSFLSSPRALLALVCLWLAPLALAQQTISATAGQVGVAYSYQVSSTATPPVLYGATGLPAGLAINTSSGLITGTPRSAGTVTGTVSITSTATGIVNSASIVIIVNPAAGASAITSATTASGTVKSAFSYTIVGSNSPTSYNVGTLPPGLTANTSTGVISGTPTTAGTTQVTISANNAGGTGAPVTLTITIAPAAGAPVINSASTATASTTAAFSYQITASNTPTAYTATGLPLGLSLNTTTGAISGTATVPGVYSVGLTASNATGSSAAFNLALTVGGLPTITSPATASGNASSAFSYQLAASNSPTSYNVGTLPAGLTVNTTSGAITGTPTTAGVTSVTVSANNATGTGNAITLVITIGSPLPTGGGTGVVIPPATVVAAPTIATQPLSQSIAEGSAVTFSVSAQGTGLNFQWSRNGVVITGAQEASYTIASVKPADAGTYVVYVSNTGGSTTSAGATLTVTAATAPAAPTIGTQPAPVSVVAGGAASFTVVATGATPLSYQWRKDGAAVAGATGASLSLANVTAASAGLYSVVVTNSAGSVTSANAALTVTSRAIAGTYFGSFANNGGAFGLLVRSDRTGLFLGYAAAAKVALYSRDVTIAADGSFSATQRGSAVESPTTTPATAAAEGDITITGTIAANGTLSGAVPALNLTFTAPAAATTGTAAAVAGFYQSGAAGSSAQSLTLISPAGDALVVTVNGATADGGTGTVTAAGALTVTTAANARITGTVRADNVLTTTVTPATGTAVTFTGANNDLRTDTEKLINISTRSLTGTATDNLIAGFVITGASPKPVLVRAIGPTLATLGVNGALSAVRLEVFRGQTSIAVGTDWGAPANNPTEVAATAARVGAFALPANSRDAALLLNLTPGNYTAIVTGQAGASGVALVEVYDATAGTIPNTQRVVNISTRATAGTGDNSLIAGFYVSGTVPKRLLIRGIGPGLTQFGTTGVLARPQLSVAAGATVLAQNAGLASSPDAAAIAAAAAQAGAFALPANSLDAALLLNLAPGAYTAQVSGAANSTGTALIEVYEIP